jgi:hypothetical protein
MAASDNNAQRDDGDHSGYEPSCRQKRSPSAMRHDHPRSVERGAAVDQVARTRSEDVMSINEISNPRPKKKN